MTLVLLVSTVLAVQGFRRDILEDFATLPLMKGQKGFGLVEAWRRFREIEVFHSIRVMLRRPHKVVAERSSRVVLVQRS